MIHETAVVQGEQIGSGTRIWQFVVLLPEARIGENCNICSHCFIENQVTVGDNVTLKSGVHLWDGISIENDVFIGPGVTFTNDLYPRSKKYAESWAKTKIEQGASVGANATILAGLVIGAYAMIGAGSVVTKNVPAFTLWYGNPAKQHGYVTESGIILSKDLIDEERNEQYQLVNGRPEKIK